MQKSQEASRTLGTEIRQSLTERLSLGTGVRNQKRKGLNIRTEGESSGGGARSSGHESEEEGRKKKWYSKRGKNLTRGKIEGG